MRSFIIGNVGAGADIQVDDEYVSGKHARVWEDDDGQVWVEDLGSLNGTYVLERRIYGPTRLEPGTILRVGRTEIPWRR